ncbi:MAG: hypothetical protein LBU22_08920 [Dysgonamonadaceae bacterium]|nr:hypothetical protein [Dysgonamonadaceae bacterium]
MKKILIILALMPALAMAQVGIGGTENPQGALDLNPATGYATKGLVLPRVESADTASYRPEEGATGISISHPKAIVSPGVVKPKGDFSPLHVSYTINDDEDIPQLVEEDYLVPDSTLDVPGGTIVYDESKDGLRVKRSNRFGNWTLPIVDETLIQDSINFRMMGGTNFKMFKASIGTTSSLAIRYPDSLVYAAGTNTGYRTGKGTTAGSDSWTIILAEKAIDVSQGEGHGLALLANGEVYSWGANQGGRNGQGIGAYTAATRYTQKPKKVLGLPTNPDRKAVQVEASWVNSMVLLEDGTVWMCGHNEYGRNGNGETSGFQTQFRQVNIPGGERVKAIAHCGAMSGVITESNKVYTWGYNFWGGIGDGSTSSGYNNFNNGRIPYRSTPTLISFTGLPVEEQRFSKIVVTASAGAVLLEDSLRMYRWGRTEIGLGESVLTPVPVNFSTVTFAPGEKIVAIGVTRWRQVGYDGAAMIIATSLGNLYATGQNNGANSTGRTNTLGATIVGYNGRTAATRAGKLGVINQTTGERERRLLVFTAVQDHGIYAGTHVTGIDIGLHATLITTGINTEYGTFAHYTAYCSGNNGSTYTTNKMIGNTGAVSLRVFGSVKE